jgi:hypothetical protein
MRTRGPLPILDVEYRVISEGRGGRRSSSQAVEDVQSPQAMLLEYALYALAFALIPAVVRALTSR